MWLAKSKSGNGYSSTDRAFRASTERRLLLSRQVGAYAPENISNDVAMSRYSLTV